MWTLQYEYDNFFGCDKPVILNISLATISEVAEFTVQDLQGNKTYIHKVIYFIPGSLPLTLVSKLNSCEYVNMVFSDYIMELYENLSTGKKCLIDYIKKENK